MGMCLDEHGYVSIEARRYSYIIYYDDIALEMDNEHLDDLQAAITDLRRYMDERDNDISEPE